MKKSIKAVLWSGLAFPGAGHFYLKRYLRGLILIVPALAGISIYLKSEYDQASSVASKLVEKIESGDVILDFSSIFAVAEKLDAQIKALQQNSTGEIAFWVFVACWVAGMVDAYLLGRSLETKVATNDSVTP
jgi:uncharacterized membrane protein